MYNTHRFFRICSSYIIQLLIRFVSTKIWIYVVCIMFDEVFRRTTIVRPILQSHRTVSISHCHLFDKLLIINGTMYEVWSLYWLTFYCLQQGNVANHSSVMEQSEWENCPILAISFDHPLATKTKMLEEETPLLLGKLAFLLVLD